MDDQSNFFNLPDKDYKHIVEQSAIIVIKIDTKGTILYMNSYALEFFGFAKEEVIGRNVVGTILEKRDQEGKNLKKMVYEVGRFPERFKRNENQNITKLGRRVWVSWTNQPVYDDDGNIKEIISLGIDLTEQKRAENELREVTGRLNVMIEYLPVAMMAQDFERKILLWNREAQNITGYSPRDIIGQIPDIFYAEPENTNLKYAKLNLEFRNFEIPIVCKDGSRKIISASSIVSNEHLKEYRNWLTFIDVTKQKEYESRLIESDYKFKEIADNLDQCILIKDINAPSLNKIIYVNHAFQKIYGFPLEYFNERPEKFYKLIHADDIHRLKHALANQFEKKYDLEYRVKRPDGTYGWVWSRSFPIHDKEGRIVRLVGITQDITFRKMAELEYLKIIEMFGKEDSDRNIF